MIRALFAGWVGELISLHQLLTKDTLRDCGSNIYFWPGGGEGSALTILY